MRIRSIVLVCLLASVPAAPLVADAQPQPKGSPPPPAKERAKPQSPPAKAPAAPELPKPKKATADLSVREAGGKEVQKLHAETGGAETVAICAYSAKDPAPDTLAFAVGTGEKWQVRGQLSKATQKKPEVQEVTVMLTGEQKTVLSWSGGADACDATASRIDAKGNAALTLRCEGVGAVIGAPRTIEVKLDMDECPKL